MNDYDRFIVMTADNIIRNARKGKAMAQQAFGGHGTNNQSQILEAFDRVILHANILIRNCGSE